MSDKKLRRANFFFFFFFEQGQRKKINAEKPRKWIEKQAKASKIDSKMIRNNQEIKK
jgi:hypothetical protein